MSNEFNLRATTREVLAESDSTDVSELSGLVFAKIPKRLYAEILEGLMREYVSDVIRLDRSANRPNGASVTPIRKGPLSHKVSAIRGWQQRLDDRIHTGLNEMKPLRLCTYDDLVFAAEELQVAAERNLTVARGYREMADALSAAGVATFGELGTETQEALLGGAA